MKHKHKLDASRAIDIRNSLNYWAKEMDRSADAIDAEIRKRAVRSAELSVAAGGNRSLAGVCRRAAVTITELLEELQHG